MARSRYSVVSTTIPNGTAAGVSTTISNLTFDKIFSKCTGIAFVGKSISPVNVKVTGTSDNVIIDETPGQLWQTSDTPVNERFAAVNFDPSIQTIEVVIKTRESLAADLPIDIVFRLEE